MVLSAMVYALFYSPWFAVGLVLLIFIHEMGHVIAMRKKGYATSAPVFIPMLGAVIFAPKFRDADTEAYVGYGGPLFGAAISIAIGLLWWLWPGQPVLLLLLAYVSAFINLFNLIPIRPLDGGRIMQAVGHWYKYVGVTVLALFTLYIRQPGFLLIWILVLGDITMSGKLRLKLAVGCWIAMVGLMFMGYSEEPLFVDIFDATLSGFMTLMYSWDAKKEKSELIPEPYPELPDHRKWAWAGYYALLFIVLLGTMFTLTPHIPTAIKP